MNKSIIDWLKVIFSERFGIDVTLRMLNEQRLEFSLIGEPGSIIFDQVQPLFFEQNKEIPFSSWDVTCEGWESAISKPIPAPGLEPPPGNLIEVCCDGFVIHYDIPGLVYWMLSRQEEVNSEEFDKFGRFPASASHAYQYDYLNRPVVDEWLFVLRQVIVKNWPDKVLISQEFSIKVSHDVDVPASYTFRSWKSIVRISLGHLIKRRDLGAFFRTIRLVVDKRVSLDEVDPVNTFSWIMDVSEKNNISSAFYFICGRTNALFDADYEIEHPAIVKLLKEINRRGHEIGLHPSFESWKSPDIIKSEGKRLKTICERAGIVQNTWGGRMHYLRWRHPITMYGWIDAKFDYDSTLGYADHAGFRCGTCFEYPAIDPVTKLSVDLRLRPLIVMECTVIDNIYMGLGETDEAYRKMLELKKTCKSVGGCFSILWHNNRLITNESKKIYCAILSSDESGPCQDS